MGDDVIEHDITQYDVMHDAVEYDVILYDVIEYDVIVCEVYLFTDREEPVRTLRVAHSHIVDWREGGRERWLRDQV